MFTTSVNQPLTSGELRAAYDAILSHLNEALVFILRINEHVKAADDLDGLGLTVEWSIEINRIIGEVLQIRGRLGNA